MEIEEMPFFQKLKRMQERDRNLEESAVHKLDAEFPALRKETAESDILERIGREIFSISGDLATALETIIDLPERLSDPSPHALTEDEKQSVSSLYNDIAKRMSLLPPLIKEWDMIKSNPNLRFVASGVNKFIKAITGYNSAINELISDEPWFNTWQGIQPTIYKRTQLIYKEYMELVMAYFARTNEEHEKTKNETDSSKRVVKAPEVVNLLKPEALKPTMKS